jgi:hypothetical protein
MQELGEHRRSAASLASPTGRGLGGRGSREIRNTNRVESVSTPVRAMSLIDLPSQRSVIGSRNGGGSEHNGSARVWAYSNLQAANRP